MARIIIFTASSVAAAEYAIGGLPVANGENFAELLKALYADPNGVLVAPAGSLVTGWTAPEGAVLVFDHTWQWPEDHAYTAQARSRVHRPGIPRGDFTVTATID